MYRYLSVVREFRMLLSKQAYLVHGVGVVVVGITDGLRWGDGEK